jgi:CheY-like chemotaxis protein
METSGMSQPRLLVVEPTEELRETLRLVLTEEGYLPHVVASFEAAQRALDEHTFALVLADLFVGGAQPGFAQARRLLRRVRPTPVGLLSTQKVSPKEVKAQGFAFLLQMPFDLEELLGLIAASTHQSFSAEQARQAEVVERVYDALNRRDLDTVLSFYTQDVVYYPIPASPIKGIRKVEGRTAFRAYLEEIFRLLPGLRFEEVLTYGRPKGLAANYKARWSAPGGPQQQLTATTLFHFLGEQITQVGVWLDSARLDQLLQLGGGG